VSIHRFGGELFDVLGEFVAKVLGGNFRPCYTDDRELAREHLAFCQVVEGRNQFATGEIAGSAEDHHRTWVANSCDWWLLSGWCYVNLSHFALPHLCSFVHLSVFVGLMPQ